jgi:uncharacterized protein
VPVLLPAVFIGRVINHRLRGDTFFKYVYIVLLGIGIFLLAKSSFG